MGECGCAATALDLRLAAPNGYYGIEAYSSCDYCSTPAGVVVHYFRNDDPLAATFMRDGESADFSHGEIALPIVDPDVLGDLLSDEAGDEREIRRDDIARALPEAVRKTVGQWRRLQSELG